MRHTYLFAFLLLFVWGFSPSPSTAQQGTLVGTIQAGDTGEPLPGANVRFEAISIGTTTDSDGAFRLEDVPVDTYDVEVSFVGYETRSKSVEIREGETTTVNFTLALKSKKFGKMVVTGSRQEERVTNAPVQIEALDDEALEVAGGETFWSSLSTVKGTDFSRIGLNQQSISMRGFDSHYNTRLVQMKDGYLTQIPGAGIPQTNYTPISELDVRQMEVVVGPASALYGPNAHTGVVNVLTKSPWDESGVALSVRGGQHDLLDLNGRVAGVIGDDFGWKVTGQYMTGTDYRPPTGGPNANAADSTHYFGTTFNETELVENYDIESIRTEGSLYYRFGDDWQIEGNYGLSVNDNFDTNTFGRLRTLDLRLQYQNLEISSDHWNLRATHTSNDGGNSYSIDNLARSAQATYLGAVQTGTSPSRARQQALEQVSMLRDSARWSLQGDLWDGEIRYDNAVGIGEGTIEFQTGLQFRRYLPTSNGTFLADARGRDLSVTERGGFVQVDYLPTDALRLNTAARVDERADNVLVSPKVALVYSVTQDHTVRLSYNRAFKSPETLQKHFFSGAVRGNNEGFVVRNRPAPNGQETRTIDPLEPEEVNSVEFGYRGIFGDHLSMNLVAYNAWYSNFISPLTVVASPDPSLTSRISQPTFGFQDGQLINDSGFLLTYFNYGQAVVRGVDLGLSYAVRDKFTLSGSVSLIERSSFEQGAAAESLLLNVPMTKVKGGLKIRDIGLNNYFINLSGRWKAAHRFRAGYWDSSQFYENGEVPARFSANLTVGYTVPGTGLQVKGSATNLFDTQVPDKLGAPRTGRLVTLSARYTFEGLGP